MEDKGGMFLGLFFAIAIWLMFIIFGPYIFAWAVNTVANAQFLVIDSFWDWFVLAILFSVIRGGTSSKKD